MKTTWQSRNRGTWRWHKLDKKPDAWYLQTEYRQLNAKGEEIWRSPHVNGYNERPPIANEYIEGK
jgi:hypothetical protein